MAEVVVAKNGTVHYVEDLFDVKQWKALRKENR